MKNVVLAVFFAGLLLIATKKTRAQTGKPNIIFILADDLGYGDLGCYGQQKIETPNIDALAKQGMLFTQFYAGTSVCAPSRASLFTGLHTGHTCIRGNVEIKPEGQYPLTANAVTIASALQQAGYQTAAFGKWGLGYPGSTGEPLKQGFDIFYGYNCQSLAHNYYPDHLWDNNNKVELKENLQSPVVYAADLIHRQALAFLKRPHAKPFFLYLPYTLPHASLYGPHDSMYNYYVHKFNEAAVNTSTNKTGYTLDAHPHAAFAAMVARLDAYTGQIMQAVKNMGLAGNTIIIFTSDNAPHNEGGADPAFFNSSGGLHGIKRDLYEGGIRVPFIAAWPGVIAAGSTNAFNGAFWDVLPTMQDVAGIKHTAGIDGISILPALKQQPQTGHNYLYWEFHENGGRQAVRMGKWKGVKLNVNKINNATLELYDLDSDPAEQHNIAPQYPAIVKQLNILMQQAHTPAKDWPLLKPEIEAAAHSKKHKLQKK